MTAFLLLHKWALLSYASFVFGQFLFLLARANSAKKNRATAVNSAWEFFKLSRIPIFVRGVLEFCGFIVLRHYPAWVAWILTWWGISLPSSVTGTLNQPLFFLIWMFVGYAADSMLDKLVYFEKLPAWLRNWIKENVPANEFYQPTQQKGPNGGANSGG